MNQNVIYIGGMSDSIFVYTLNRKDGSLTPLGGPVAAGEKPAFFAFDRNRGSLYSVNEIQEYEGNKSGAVCAFRIDPTTGALMFLNRVASQLAGPCHVATDRTGRFLFLAHYIGAGVTVIPVLDDGTLGPATDVKDHGPKSHAHSCMVDPSNRYVFVADLGLDRVFQYLFDAETGTLVPNEVPDLEFPKGAGPRHMDMHPNGKFVYVLNQRNNTMTACDFDATTGRLAAIETLGMIPDDFEEFSSASDVHVLSPGRFLYGSNRGHESIVMYSIDQSSGRIALADRIYCGGKEPRVFHVEPTGDLALVAHQNSDTVSAFRIEPDTGKLTPTGTVTSVPQPTYVGRP